MNYEYVTNVVLTACNDAERFIRETMARAPGALRWMIDHNIVTFLAPDDVKERLVAIYLAIMREAAILFYDGIALLRLIARGPGRPTELRSAADALDTNANSTKSLTDSMKPQALLGVSSQDEWKSRATVPYSAGHTEQVESAAGIGEIMRALEKTLRDVADSIESFYAELIWAVVGYFLAVVGLALCFTGPPAIVGIVLAAIGVGTAIVSLLVVVDTTFAENTANADTLIASPSIKWNQSEFAK